MELIKSDGKFVSFTFSQLDKSSSNAVFPLQTHQHSDDWDNYFGTLDRGQRVEILKGGLYRIHIFVDMGVFAKVYLEVNGNRVTSFKRRSLLVDAGVNYSVPSDADGEKSYDRALANAQSTAKLQLSRWDLISVRIDSRRMTKGIPFGRIIVELVDGCGSKGEVSPPRTN